MLLAKNRVIFYQTADDDIFIATPEHIAVGTAISFEASGEQIEIPFATLEACDEAEFCRVLGKDLGAYRLVEEMFACKLKHFRLLIPGRQKPQIALFEQET